ncbi:response regulator [Sphingobacterium detergens]|uniref:Response regulator receiver domain-containing protein n=1 Tax=Sphingobacterium detergens TaxID=1145106 RepID=A0A420BK67_SPHD1|nr:response regulator [Sphingobacterium detergens]RKE57112.1 response regulator receiver domain-containing protein [Sphingobacterium detergens]
MNKKIFVCDDNLVILEALVLILRMTDAMVVAESKSAKALNYIINEKPVIFICDLQMPGLNGEGLIRQIRAHNELNDLFILCISASYDARDIAINSGADYFLAKPFEINELLAVVNCVLVAGTC